MIKNFEKVQLVELRDKGEFLNYFEGKGIKLKDEQIQAIKEVYNNKDINGSKLTTAQLSEVAGGFGQADLKRFLSFVNSHQRSIKRFMSTAQNGYPTPLNAMGTRNNNFSPERRRTSATTPASNLGEKLLEETRPNLANPGDPTHFGGAEVEHAMPFDHTLGASHELRKVLSSTDIAQMNFDEKCKHLAQMDQVDRETFLKTHSACAAIHQDKYQDFFAKFNGYNGVFDYNHLNASLKTYFDKLENNGKANFIEQIADHINLCIKQKTDFDYNSLHFIFTNDDCAQLFLRTLSYNVVVKLRNSSDFKDYKFVQKEFNYCLQHFNNGQDTREPIDEKTLMFKINVPEINPYDLAVPNHIRMQNIVRDINDSPLKSVTDSHAITTTTTTTTTTVASEIYNFGDLFRHIEQKYGDKDASELGDLTDEKLNELAVIYLNLDEEHKLIFMEALNKLLPPEKRMGDFAIDPENGKLVGLPNKQGHFVFNVHTTDLSYRNWGTGAVIKNYDGLKDVEGELGKFLRRSENIRCAGITLRVNGNDKFLSLAALPFDENFEEILNHSQKTGLKALKEEAGNQNGNQESDTMMSSIPNRSAEVKADGYIEIDYKAQESEQLADVLHNHMLRALQTTVPKAKKEEFENPRIIDTKTKESTKYEMTEREQFWYLMTYKDGELIKYHYIDKSGETQEITFPEYILQSEDITWQQKLLYFFYPDGGKLIIKPWVAKLLENLDNKSSEVMSELTTTNTTTTTTPTNNLQSKDEKTKLKILFCEFLKQAVKESSKTILNGLTKKPNQFFDNLSFYFEVQPSGALKFKVDGSPSGIDDYSMEVKNLDLNTFFQKVFANDQFEIFGKLNRLLIEYMDYAMQMAYKTAMEKIIGYIKQAAITLLISGISATGITAIFTNGFSKDKDKK